MKPKPPFFTWMAQIARNTAIDRKRLKSFEMVSKTESFVVAETNLRTEANKSDIDIKDLIKDMPEKYKVLVAKMFLEGYTQQEIADEMDIPLGTCISML